MSRAILDIKDLIDFKNMNLEFENGINNVYNSLSMIMECINKTQQEISEYVQSLNECNSIISELEHKLQLLKARQSVLKVEIPILKVAVAELTIETEDLAAKALATPPPLNIPLLAVLSAKQAELASKKVELAQKEEELIRIENNIIKAEALLAETEQMIMTIQNNIAKLQQSISNMTQSYRMIEEQCTFFIAKTKIADEKISSSLNCANGYLSERLDNIVINHTKPQLRLCINREMSGSTYDFRNILDQYEATKDEALLEKYNYFKNKYPDIRFSKIDEYGNTYPDFSKYEEYSYKFPPVTKENLENGTCLIGDSRAQSPDFKKLWAQMGKDGYTKQQIAEIRSRCTPHHDEDGMAIRLIPRELHAEVKHNGGASNIRRKISEIGWVCK